MISYLRGHWRGRKLAIETGILCKDITNFLINNNFETKLPDTAYILQESYAICKFMLTRPSMNYKQIGAMIVMSQDILRNWLLGVFSESKKDYDFTKSVNVVIEGLPEFTLKWIKELGEKHSDLKGKNIYKWLPAANAHFLHHVSFYIYGKFGREPDNFASALNHFIIIRMNKLLTFWDKLGLSSSLEEDLPEDFKKKSEKLK